MASRDNLSPSLKLCSSNPPNDAGRKTSRQERRRHERRKRKFKPPFLNVDNIMAVLEPLPWRIVGDYLCIHLSKLDAMDTNYTTDEEKKGAVIRYWLLRDPHASWRMLVYRLDRNYEFDIADQIRNYVERQTDPSLTCDSLLTALDTVKNAKDSDEIENSCNDILEDILHIPRPRSKEMRSQCIDSEEDYRKKFVEYYIAMSPWGSWNFVAGELLYSKQHRALEKVKGNVKVDKGI